MKNSLPKGYWSRPATMDDLKAAVEMFNVDARQTVGIGKFILQEVGSDWQTPGFNLDTDTQIVLSPDGNICGYYEVWDLEPHVSINCWGRVHPEHTNLGLVKYLLEWAHNRALQAIPKAPFEARVTMQCTAICLNQAAQDLFQDAGMQSFSACWARNWLDRSPRLRSRRTIPRSRRRWMGRGTSITSLSAGCHSGELWSPNV